MKIFITGATGFIGKHLVRKLVDERNDITINLYGEEQSPFEANVNTYSLNENFIEKDIEFLKNHSFDGIIHLASLYLTTHKPEDAIRLINSNVSFSTYILECASQANIKWFINTGTFWQHYQNANYSPVNLYAATKQAFESIAQYYVETEKIIFCTIKLSDTFGPNDTRPKIFNLWDKFANTGDPLKMSSGNQVIDISYSDDIINAFILLAKELQSNNKEILNGNTYAVKSKNRYTLKELASIFEKTTNKKIKIEWGALPYREREVMNPWSKGQIVPNWKQQLSLEEGIRKVFFKT